MVTKAITTAYAAEAANRTVIQDRGTIVGDGQSNRRDAGPLSGTCLSVSIDMHPPASAILAATRVTVPVWARGSPDAPESVQRVITSLTR